MMSEHATTAIMDTPDPTWKDAHDALRTYVSTIVAMTVDVEARDEAHRRYADICEVLIEAENSRSEPMSGDLNPANLEVHCGRALAEHYSDIPWQTFHHEPSVAAVVLDAVPDGWAKIDGEWVRGNGRRDT